jgi:hypothetical protein
MELTPVVSAYQSPVLNWTRFGEVFSMFSWFIVLILLFVWYMYSLVRNMSRTRKMRGG